jgi:UDP-N-acetylbacillosamine N-acetyltransferase
MDKLHSRANRISKRSACPIVIFGAGGHALVVADILELMGEFRLVGFLDEKNPQRRGERFGCAHVLGGWSELTALSSQGLSHAIVAVGQCAARVRIAGALADAGFSLVNAIHPRATVASGVQLGAGIVVAANAVINPGSTLGGNVIINTGATVDHECSVGAGAHVGPGVHLAGKVTIGDRAWIGIGAIVIDRVTIGADACVGAGSVVIADVLPGTLAYGVPARMIRKADSS